ncbi:MAG: hypothetical protein NTZ78_01340 [Candidatus Aureabacteria bacterium]|nr:hypothetical protein [Candidatus Auribacterota bacterium]
MKRLMTVLFVLIFASGMAGMAVAGSLDSLGSPSAGSGMYTLQNLYDYLTSGTALTVQTGFQEPTSEPGSTMKTTKDVGDDIAARFDQCEASPSTVASGTKFFSTQTDNWGVKTGTLALTGNAVAADVISDKTFYSNSWTRQTGALTQYPATPSGWTGACVWKEGNIAECPSGYTNKHTRTTCAGYGCTGGGARCYVAGSGTDDCSCSGQGCNRNCANFYFWNLAGSGTCMGSQTYTYCCI